MVQVAVLPVFTEAKQKGLGMRVQIGAKFLIRWVESGWVWR